MMMADKEFLIVEANGSPYEIGLAHGSKAKRQVLKSIETYKNMS
jgi:hypothetical protein